MKIVLVFGTFDVLHPGHQWFLKEVSQYGERIIAVISRDSYVKEWKKKAPLQDEQTRIKEVIKTGLVENAILADPVIGTYNVLQTVQPDVVCLGHDQKKLKENLTCWILQHKNSWKEMGTPKIYVLPPWNRDIHSSTRHRPLSG